MSKNRMLLLLFLVAFLTITFTGQGLFSVKGAEGTSLPDENISELMEKAEQGDEDAQVNLGIMYKYGQGVPKNYSKAVKFLSLAAKRGEAKAQFHIGTLYDFGRGVPKNYSEALKWYQMAAD